MRTSTKASLAALLVLGLAACGDDGGGAAPGGAGPGDIDELDPDFLSCEEVIPIADYNRITGLNATACTFGNGFVDGELGGLVDLEVHPSPESARAEYEEDALSEDGSCFGTGFTGNGWEACEIIGIADAVAGRLLITVSLDLGNDDSAAEIAGMTALIDEIVARHGG